jgi:Undecaprenyl-phosphate galactose phosphotransferase WbaP
MKLKNFVETVILLCGDLIALIAIFRLAVLVRTHVLPLLYSGFPAEFPHRRLVDASWLLLMWLFFFGYEGLYTKRFSIWDEIKALWKAAIYSVVSIFVIVSLGKLSSEISRTVILLMGLLAMGIMPATRTVLKKGLRKMGLLKRRALILGAGDTGRLILRALQRESNYGYDVLGFVDDNPAIQGGMIDGLKVHGGLDRVERYISSCRIQDVLIAIPEEGWGKMKSLLNSLQHKAERVLFVPGISGIAVLGTSLQHFFHDQTFALEVKNNLAEPLNVFLKRCFDFVLCLLFLPILLPLTAIIALIIKLDSKGPVMFSHERVGRRGKLFGCLKFRSMYKDAEERLATLLNNSPNVMQEWKQYRKLKNDPRITSVGRFLRKTSLDELPQIFNVIKGEMSFVGPRPVTQDEVDVYYKDNADLIFSISPGITGLWQVSGRSNTSYNHRIALDTWYIRNWTPWLDIVLVINTLPAVLKKEGAM